MAHDLVAARLGGALATSLAVGHHPGPFFTGVGGHQLRGPLTSQNYPELFAPCAPKKVSQRAPPKDFRG